MTINWQYVRQFVWNAVLNFAEGSRWSDIRRWRIVEQLPEMCGDDYGMNFAGTNSQEFYKRTVFQTRVWKRAMYWFPVYIDEMNKNTNLVQAPFWN